MYENFYGLRKAPFANVPDPQFLFMSSQHEQALATLEYALVSRAGFGVITGDIGAGKTTLLRRVLQLLNGQILFGLVSNSRCNTFDELLRWILLSLDLEYRGKSKVEMYEDLVALLIRQYHAGVPVALVIDEAQNLSVNLLEQLRMLSNVNSEKGLLLQVILVGQPELLELLHHPKLEQFAQRISYEYFLEPLNGSGAVREYVEHRLQVAGGAPGLFSSETFPLIAEASRGVPRLINLICDHALVYGYSVSASIITGELVVQALTEMPLAIASLASATPTELAPATPLRILPEVSLTSADEAQSTATVHDRQCEGSGSTLTPMAFDRSSPLLIHAPREQELETLLMDSANSDSAIRLTRVADKPTVELAGVEKETIETVPVEMTSTEAAVPNASNMGASIKGTVVEETRSLSFAALLSPARARTAQPQRALSVSCRRGRLRRSYC